MRVERHPILEDKIRETITIFFEGRAIEAYEGEPIASALINAGIRSFRRTAKTGSKRGIFCAIGRCTDCMMIVDGKPNVRTCVTLAVDGMHVETQYGRGERKA